MKPGKCRLCIIGLFLLACFAVTEISSIHMYQRWDDPGYFRQLKIPPEVIRSLSARYGYGTADFMEGITQIMMKKDFNPNEKLKIHRKGIPWYQVFYKALWNRYYNWYQSILKDIRCFPVPPDEKGDETVRFDNSWMGARTYGGKRFHEGCDIMASNNVRGYFPVVSMTSGVVEQKGWLEKGGYRIGIRSPSGAYFYYAHLYEYAEGIEIGDLVTAGQILGTMGDSGYGTEGTTGQFDVHLHMGIYIDVNGKEVSINPYYILNYLYMEREGEWENMVENVEEIRKN